MVVSARVRIAATLLVGAAIAVGAPVASAAPPKPVPLTGTQWRLESSGVARSAPVRYTGAPAYLTVRGKHVGGNDGCNGFGGDANVVGDKVTFGPIISTQMACIRPGAGALFRTALKDTRTVRITGNRLQLLDGPRGYWNFVTP